MRVIITFMGGDNYLHFYLGELSWILILLRYDYLGITSNSEFDDVGYPECNTIVLFANYQTSSLLVSYSAR